MSKSYIVTARQCRIMHVLISACRWVMAHYHSLGSLEYLVSYIYIYIYIYIEEQDLDTGVVL